MTADQKEYIDNASYATLLREWRFQKLGSDTFAGERGDYFARVMFAKKEAIGPDAALAVSKAVGWGQPSE